MLLRRLGISSTTRRHLRRIGLPASARELRLLGRPLGTAAAARNPNLATPYPEHAAYLRRVLRGGAVWLGVGLCLVVAMVVFVPVVGIAAGLIVVVASGALAIMAHRPERVHPTLPIRAEHPSAPLHCPWYFRERAQVDGPVFACSSGTRHVVFVTNLELGARALVDHRDELTTVSLPFDALIPDGFIRYMAPNDHRNARRPVASARRRVRSVAVNDRPAVRGPSCRARAKRAAAGFRT